MGGAWAESLYGSGCGDSLINMLILGGERKGGKEKEIWKEKKNFVGDDGEFGGFVFFFFLFFKYHTYKYS